MTGVKGMENEPLCGVLNCVIDFVLLMTNRMVILLLVLVCRGKCIAVGIKWYICNELLVESMM